MSRKTRINTALAGAGLALALTAGATVGQAGAATMHGGVVKLTQTACQFIESEGGVDRGFKTAKAADCVAHNEATGEARLAEAEVIELEAGTHTFRVTNRDVPYQLGFWLREADYNPRNPLHKLTKISVSGGGLTTGATKDYTVELEPGEYLYSCPLNPTLNYHLVVTG